ncbi:MAG: TonB-dependent receptor [Pseudomonadota bacterium]
MKLIPFTPKGLVAAIVATSASIGFTTVTHAQSVDADQATQRSLEEVIVTATKRAQTLEDTPISITVTSAETIDTAKIQDILDLQSVVPSLRTSTDQSTSATSFFIRGFGNGANDVGTEPSVAVFVDGVYRSRTTASLGDFPKLERIEVIKGPQNTLFGKNASAGVVSMVTSKASFEREGYLEGIFGNYSSAIVKGYYTDALVDEKLAFSIGGSVNQRDGYAENVSGGNDIGERNRDNIRAELLFRPSKTQEWRLIVDHDDLDEICCYSANLVRGDIGDIIELLGGEIAAEAPYDYKVTANEDPSNIARNTGISLQGDIALNDTLTLTSITAYRQNQTRLFNDFDYTSADLTNATNELDINTFTQEIRLTSSFDGPFNFLVGAFYFDEEIDQETGIFYGDDFRDYVSFLAGQPFTFQSSIEEAIGIPVGTFHQGGQGTLDSGTMDNQSITVFGQVDYELTNRLTATIGLAYLDDSKEVTLSQVNTDVFSNINLGPELLPLQFLPQTLAFPNAVEDGETDDDNIDYTLRLTFAINDFVNVYGSFATGYKASSWVLANTSAPTEETLQQLFPGGVGRPFNQVVGTRFADPEEAEVFEIGLKTSFSTGYVNVALFDQTIENFQSNIFDGQGLVLANAEEQSVSGVEFDARWSPTASLDVIAALTYLDPEYNEFTGSILGDLSGTTPSNISDFASTVAVTYRFNLSGYEGYARVDWQYESAVDLRDGGSLNPENAILESVGHREREVNTFNASIGATLGRWDVSLWGRNIFNDEYLVAANPSAAQPGIFNGNPNQPATYGVSARLNF